MSTGTPTPTTGVITERQSGPWTQCTGAAAMMMVRDAGTAFPLHDLAAELNALEPDRPGGEDLAGIVAAMDARYHFSGHPVSDLMIALVSPGITLLLQGNNANLATRLRRWDPSFAGGHAAAVRVTSTGLVWLDPEAPMGYPGERITRAEVIAWAWGPKFARYATWGEAAPSPEVPDVLPVTDRSAVTASVKQGAQVFDLAGKPLVTMSADYTVTSPFAVSATRRAVILNTGGVTQLALMNTADLHNPVPVSGSTHTVVVSIDGKPVSTTEV